MTEISGRGKRPLSITIICALGFVGALIAVYLVFSPFAQQVGSWYQPYLGFSVIVGLACMIGLWLMKKWAAYTYTGFVIINQIILLIMGVWDIQALIIPGIVIIVALKNVPNMT